MSKNFETVNWQGGIDGHLVLLDQTQLPEETVYIECRTAEDVWHAIKRLSVRGARQSVSPLLTEFASRKSRARRQRSLRLPGHESPDSRQSFLGD